MANDQTRGARMQKKIKTRFANISVRVMLGLLFAIVAIIPMLAIGYISIHTVSNTALERSVQQSRSELELTEYRLVELMRQKHRETLVAAFNKNVRTYYEKDDSRLSNPRSVVENETKKQLISLFNSGEDEALELLSFTDTQTLWKDVAHSGVRVLDGEPAQADPSQFRLFDDWGTPTYLNDVAVWPYSRIILDMDNEPAALLTLYVKESQVAKLYSEYEMSGGEFYVIDLDGVIVSSSNASAYAQSFDTIVKGGLDAFAQQSGYLRTDGYVYVYKINPQREFALVERIPESEVMAGMFSISRSIVYVALISLVVCVLLGVLMARTFTQPLYRLIKRIQPHTQRAATAPARNEIVLLSDRYDQIIDRLDTLIVEYYEEQRKKREAEIRALEFQINPHFLYNTLSTIIWLIEAGKGNDAIHITKQLAAFFRISVNKSRKNVSIAEELYHVALYMDIQCSRYEGIDFQVEVPEALRNFRTPKLILQPLAENSIIHGLQTDPDLKCRIVVRAIDAGSDIVFEVEDDGKAATEESIRDMNEFLAGGRSRFGKNYGIGITNVNERVGMRYGEGYGLSYRRENGLTIAQVRIKKTDGEDEDV